MFKFPAYMDKYGLPAKETSFYVLTENGTCPDDNCPLDWTTFDNQYTASITTYSNQTVYEGDTILFTALIKNGSGSVVSLGDLGVTYTVTASNPNCAAVESVSNELQGVRVTATAKAKGEAAVTVTISNELSVQSRVFVG